MKPREPLAKGVIPLLKIYYLNIVWSMMHVSLFNRNKNVAIVEYGLNVMYIWVMNLSL